MRAIVYHGPGAVRPGQVPDPIIEDPRDVIVKVDLAAICGSDLHVWHGLEDKLDPGTVMGHEFVGRVIEAGKDVVRMVPGTRVVSPFSTNCGDCFYCRIGLTARCYSGQLFGWVENGYGLHGAQAEFVRVPHADATLFRIPADLPAEVAILMGDTLATGYHAALLAGVNNRMELGVVGCGPVGLAAIIAAQELDVGWVIGLEEMHGRIVRAGRLGAGTVRSDCFPVEDIRMATGAGLDAVIEAVGSPDALKLAFDITRMGGTIASVGVHHEPHFPFSPGQFYDKNLTYKSGRCSARHYMKELLPIAYRRKRDLKGLFTHSTGITDAAEAYEMFSRKTDRCIKVAVRPKGTMLRRVS